MEIPQAVRDALEDPNEKVLCVYTAEIFSVHNISSVPANYTAYYVTAADNWRQTAFIETEDGVQQFYTSLDAKVLDFFIHAKILDYAGADMVIENVYCLDGNTHGQGTALYYQLSRDRVYYTFVYFHHPQLGEFLFPGSEFSEYCTAIRSDPQMRYGLYDLTPYDLNSDSFALKISDSEADTLPAIYLVLICIGSLVLIGALAVILTRIYKKKSQHLEDTVVPLDIVCPPPGVPVMDPGDEVGVLYRP